MRWHQAEDNFVNVFQVNDLVQHVWSFPTTDAFGEKTGPIITLSTIHDIVRQMRNGDFSNEASLMSAMDEYIEKVLKGLSLNNSAYEEFKTAYFKHKTAATCRDL